MRERIIEEWHGESRNFKGDEGVDLVGDDEGLQSKVAETNSAIMNAAVAQI